MKIDLTFELNTFRMKESKALWILSTYGLVGSDLGVKMKYGYGELDWWKLKEKEI